MKKKKLKPIDIETLLEPQPKKVKSKYVTGLNYCGLNVNPSQAREMYQMIRSQYDHLLVEWDGSMTQDRKKYLKDFEYRMDLLQKIQHEE